MIRFMLLFVILGIVLMVFGVNEYRLGSASKSTPQTISCAQLEQNGPGDNAYVTLTDFEPSQGSFVYEAKDGSTTWDTVWVPLYAGHSGAAERSNAKTSFKVLLYSTKYHNQGELQSIDNMKQVTGMIINKISSLGSKQRSILESSYPGVDINSVWILQEDRTPRGSGFIFGMIGSGIALILVGIGLGLKKFLVK